VLAENDLAEYTLSSPAISEGQIFIRTESALYAIGKRMVRKQAVREPTLHHAPRRHAARSSRAGSGPVAAAARD
jgi:hypothetical protein